MEQPNNTRRQPTRRSVSGERRSSARPSAAPRPDYAERQPSRPERGSRPERTRTERPSASVRGASTRSTSSRGNAPRSVTTRRAAVPSASGSMGVAAVNPIQKFLPLIVMAAGVLILVLIISSIVRSCSSSGEQPTAPLAGPKPNATVSFLAVGDNLPDQVLGDYAAQCAEAAGKDGYDYSPIYEFITPLVQAADLSFVKEEVHLDSEFGPHGYPSFNAPEDLADDLVEAGFDVVGSASNHIYDWGFFGALQRNREVWNTKNVLFVGTNLNEEEANTIGTIERNGITFAFLDYTYGVNSYEPEDFEWYEVNFIDKDRITRDVARAKEVAEVVVVVMHWGTENLTVADDFQKEYAQLLANLDVDLVIGSHPHVIGPVNWVSNAAGDHQTLVLYSLGNFLSHHETPGPYNQIEGMFNCDFVRENGEVRIENPVWTTLINHTGDVNNYYRVIPLRDYTNELASTAYTLDTLDDAVTWLRTEAAKIVGTEVPINDGPAEGTKSEGTKQ